MFLRLPTVIDTVQMDVLLGMNYVTFAESWMIDGEADPHSIKVFHWGSEKPVHAQMTLQQLASRSGFILLNVWKFGSARKKKALVVNVTAIKQMRPYTDNGTGRIDHYVLYFSEGKESGMPIEFHISSEEAALLKAKMNLV
jgi:hypothetical protein